MASRPVTLAVSLLISLGALALPSSAAARRTRPRFEPTDLDLEDPGDLEADLQLGFAHGEDAWRFVVPDFELDLGLTDFLELDIDGAYALEGRAGEKFSIDHGAPDSLWIAAKLGIFDTQADDAESAIAVGLQLGPKLPAAAVAHGVGGEALLLVGTKLHRLLLVWNAGAFVEPAPDATATRPRGLELGMDAELDLDSISLFSAIASVGYVHFWSADSDQLAATMGVSWQVMDALELSALALVGLLEGGDRFALLLGITPKLRLFGN